MDRTKDQYRKNVILDIVLVVVILVTLFVVRESLFDVIRPFIYALVVAYLMNPLLKLFDKIKFPRVVSILLVFSVIIGLLVALFAIFVPILVEDISVLAKEIPDVVKNVEKFLIDFREGNLPFLNNIFGDFIDVDREIERLGQFFSESLNYIYRFLISSSGTLLHIIMTPIIAFYYLKDKDKIVNKFFKFVNSRYHYRIRQIAKDVNRVVGGFIRGQLFIAVFVGGLTGLGCWVIGVPYALTIGVVAGITNIIPYFGPWLGGVLPVILAFVDKPITALWVIILIVVVQQIEAAFISPQVMSHSVGIHPLLVIFSVIFFGRIMGIAGMIIAVPLIATIILFGRYIMEYRARSRSKFLLP